MRRFAVRCVPCSVTEDQKQLRLKTWNDEGICQCGKGEENKNDESVKCCHFARVPALPWSEEIASEPMSSFKLRIVWRS